MKTDLGIGYIIEGFDTEISKDALLDAWYHENELIWHGKTSKISREIAKKILKLHPYSINGYACYFEYDNPELELNNTSNETLKNKDKSRNDHLWHWQESILSACSQPYCIIYKTK